MASRSTQILSVQLKNIRGFEDTGRIDLRRFNFVFGKNSSGKTTLLRSIPLFRQILEAAQHSTISNALAGPYVDFGSYRETVRDGLVSRDINLAFTIDTSRYMERYLGRRARTLKPSPTHVDAQLHWNKTRGHVQFSYIEISTSSGRMRLKRLGPNRAQLTGPDGLNQNIELPTEMGFHSFRYIEFELLDRENEDRTARSLSLEMLVTVDGIQAALQNVHHIGPLRDMPERAYRTDQLSNTNDSTKSALSMLTAERQAIPAVSRALRSMNMARDLEITNIAPGYAGIAVHSVGSNRKDSLADVGFGVSQVLPILARLATARRGSLVLVEQPELHLHPETQGSLLDAMVEIAQERDVNLFVESHSESMLLRIRRKIATGQLDPSDVQILVVDNGEVNKIDVDSAGGLDFHAFPKDFFEEDWIDTIEIAKSAASRAQ